MHHNWHWSHLNGSGLCVSACIYPPFSTYHHFHQHTLYCTQGPQHYHPSMAFGFTIADRDALYCIILGIHGALIKLLLDVSREHSQCLCPKPEHDSGSSVCMFPHGGNAGPTLAHSQLRPRHRICVLCSCVTELWWGLTQISCKKHFRTHVLYTISVKMQSVRWRRGRAEHKPKP